MISATPLLDRRSVLQLGLVGAAGAVLPQSLRRALAGGEEQGVFNISLAQWSLHRALSGGGLELELLSHAQATAPRDPMDMSAKVMTRGWMKVGLHVTNFDATIAALRSRGIEIVNGPWPPRTDQRANAMIRDNAGNLIQIFGEYSR